MGSYNIAEFRELIRKAKHASDPEIKLALLRVASEAKTKLGDPSLGAGDFFESVRQALQQIKGNGNGDVRIDCLLDCAQYFYIAGDFLRGIMASQDALKLSKQVKDPHCLRRSLTILGIFQAESGSIAQAIESYVEAIDVATQTQDDLGLVASLTNLGVALLYAGQFDDAISCLKVAEPLSEKLDAESLLPTLLANQAACLLRLGKVEEGLSLAARAVERKSPPRSATETFARMVHEFNYLQLLLEANKPRLAAERARLIKGYSSKVSSIRAKTIVKLSEGLFETFFGDPANGLDQIRMAKEEAKTSTALYQDALMALVKVYEQLGRNEEALTYLDEYLVHVRKTRQELAIWHVQTGSKYLRSVSTSVPGLGVLEQREAVLRALVAEDRALALQMEMLERLAVTADLREEASGQHGLRVGRLAAEFARQLGWNPKECFTLDLAARLHDLGKIGMPDRILLASDRLKDAERHFMCSHTIIGAEILSTSHAAQLK